MVEKQDNDTRWRLFLINSTFIRNYKLFDRMKMAPNALQPETPFLDDALPGLLFIKAVALLDDFFEEYIKQKLSSQSRSFRADLNGRIELLKSVSKISNYDELHKFRKTRNRLAHDSKESIEWDLYDSFITHAQEALSDLGVLTKHLKIYTCSAERSALKTDDDKKNLGIVTYNIYVLEDGIKAAEYEWQEQLLVE